MKIGILTQPLQSNYGGLLQAYALQVILKRMGHEVLTVDRHFKRKFLYQKLIIVIKRLILRFILQRKDIISILPFEPTKEEAATIRRNTIQFIKENIETTSVYDSKIKAKDLKNYHFEAYIVGSDQVWRPKYSPNIANYFLDFLKDNKSVKRISYAASFGVDEWEFTPGQTKRCKAHINKFNSISVREESGVKLCKEKFGVEGIQVLDPTMLLNKDDYIKLIRNESLSKIPQLLMVYILDYSEIKLKIIQRITLELKLDPNFIIPKGKLNKENRKQINSFILPSLPEWLNGFFSADFVVTDSFHGTVFALIFNKQFICIANKKRGTARMSSLLVSLGLIDRMIFNFDDLSDVISLPLIIYKEINPIIEKQKLKSFAFLSNIGL